MDYIDSDNDSYPDEKLEIRVRFVYVMKFPASSLSEEDDQWASNAYRELFGWCVDKPALQAELDDALREYERRFPEQKLVEQPSYSKAAEILKDEL